VLVVGSITVSVVCSVASLGDPRGAFCLSAVTVVIVITLYALYVLSKPINPTPFR
jgi:hypothetical protein